MKAPLLPGNDVRLLCSGVEFFPALVAAINAARHEVHLETYLFENDVAGHAVASALRDAAMRGVVVRVLVDGFGGRSFVRDLMPGLEEVGVEVLIFRRELRLFSFRRHRLRRMHRKMAVIDAQVAFVGGINIIDDMNTPGRSPPRFDYAVRVEGPLLGPIHFQVVSLWTRMCWASFRRRPHPVSRVHAGHAPVGRVRAAFLVRDNLRHRNDIEQAYLEAIGRAHHELIIANAYFLPGRKFRTAILQARKRGVEVTLMLQGKVEYWLLHHACQALYPQMLNAGVRIVEYRKSFLHAKVAVIDDDWATVGSSNIDPFSLLLAREANVVVRDAGFANQLRISLRNAMDNDSASLPADDWQNRSLLRRSLCWVAYGLVRGLISMAGYGRSQ